MARKRVLDLKADTTLKFEKIGQMVEGYYIGSKSVKAKFGMTNLHILQTEAGPLGAWGSAQLDSKLASIPKGHRVWITYTNKIQVPSGSMKTFDVDWDDEDSMDVSSTTVNYAPSSEPEYGAEASGEAQDVDQDEPSSDDDNAVEENPVAKRPARGAAPTPATMSEQAKRANALLNKQRSRTA